MASRSIQVTITNAFQVLTTLIAAKLTADGLPPLSKLSFRTVVVMAAKSTAGIISFQMTAIGTNPFLELEAGERPENLTSGGRFNLNSLEGINVKSTIDAATEKINILLQE